MKQIGNYVVKAVIGGAIVVAKCRYDGDVGEIEAQALDHVMGILDRTVGTYHAPGYRVRSQSQHGQVVCPHYQGRNHEAGFACAGDAGEQVDAPGW